ncbi:extracellular metalloprotease precursor [Paraphoma chrysanthemicola]|nr:extracellular metalloprotease precursor [Paraphoma chrysanthemicola]
MSRSQQFPICGFVPPYVLEAIAASDLVAEESQKACRDTLKYINSRAEHDHGISGLAQTSTAQGQQPLVEAPVGANQGSQTSLRRMIYDCKDTASRPGTLARSEGDSRVKDRQINNCYDGFKITHDFYSRVFGRNSLDNAGLVLIGSVHFKPDTQSTGLNNAFWDGRAKQMVFGDGDHISFDYFTDSLDVIAHELGHGFVQHSSPLLYEWQSGALNESCADVFGAMVEQWHMRQTVEDADWNIGQTLFPVAFTGSALRTLKAGKAYIDDPVFGTDRQPKHMKDLYTGDDDRRGVHRNSGIPNHAFYLAAKAIGGNSWDKAGKVWYKTMTSGKIPYTCDFETFANVTVEIAAKEFGGSVEKAIRDAWVKVGVLSQL